MATTYQKQNTKRRRGKRREKESTPSRFLMIGAGVLVLGLLTFGMIGILGGGDDQGVHSTNVQSDTAGEAAPAQEVVEQEVAANGSAPTQVDNSPSETAAEVAAAPVDRETRFLGPPSDPAGLVLAEAGGVGQPTLVWFHADWCHVCQRVKPEVVDLGEQYDGKVKFVRVNIDYQESRDVVRRYGVRATPTFVLIDAQGQLRGNVPGWPGYQAFTSAFDQLLAGG